MIEMSTFNQINRTYDYTVAESALHFDYVKQPKQYFVAKMNKLKISQVHTYESIKNICLEPVVGHNDTLKIVCGEPGATPSQQMTTTQSPVDLTGHPTAIDSTTKDQPMSTGSLMDNNGKFVNK